MGYSALFKNKEGFVIDDWCIERYYSSQITFVRPNKYVNINNVPLFEEAPILWLAHIKVGISIIKGAVIYEDSRITVLRYLDNPEYGYVVINNQITSSRDLYLDDNLNYIDNL